MPIKYATFTLEKEREENIACYFLCSLFDAKLLATKPNRNFSHFLIIYAHTFLSFVMLLLLHIYSNYH